MLPPLFVSAFHPLSCLGILCLSSLSHPHLTLTRTVPLFCMAGCLGLRFGDSTANLCSLSPPPPPLHFQSVTPPSPSTVGVQTQTGLRTTSPVCIERTRFLQGGLVDGVPLLWSFSQKECQDISAKQTARDGSKKAPALSCCEKNALTIHRTITKAIKDKARANV